MRRITALLAALALVLALFPSLALAAPSANGSWIVTLRPGVDPSSAAPGLARQHGGRIGFVYERAIRGFSFRGSQAAADALLRNPKVAAVEADAEVQLDTTQTGATWGLDRIDQRALPLSTTYSYERTGAGVTAYVIDSGINYGHADFGGRAVAGTDLVGGVSPSGSDCNGHGTHVAGTIGGATWGVAKDVTLVSVRVFGCTGGSSWSTIIAGLDWVIGDHAAGEPAVANMSLGGGGSSAVDAATNNLINDGVSTAVAAGNGDFLGRQANACNYSPARVANAMTISATTSSDQKVSWANYGNCVDWFAPGVSIVSASHASTTGTATKSGTSMATPHTAGVAALYLEANPSAAPAAVRTAIYDATTKGVVANSSSVNNHLLYSGFLVGGGGGSDSPPNVAVTSPADGATVSGTITVSATATDTEGVAQVEFFVDGTSIGADTNGSNGWSATWNTAGSANGLHTVTATATDTKPQTASDSVDVTVDNAPAPPSTFGLSLAGAPSGSGNSWTATVTITATASGAPLSGVQVSGSWSNGGSSTCTTQASGTCTVSRSQPKRVGSVTFTVTGATASSGQAYDGGPDSATVLKS